MDVFTGSIERVTFYNEDNGYSVIKVRPDKRLPRTHMSNDGLVTIVGIMPEMGVGEDAQFEGEWVDDPRFGLQMRIQTITPIVPTSEEGITRYLSSGIVRGIGPSTAKKIVDHFGTETLTILNREPHRLQEVPQLKTSLAEKLAIAWEENAAVRQTMIYLQGYGISSRMATRIHAEYGSATIQTLENNPYSLAEDVFGIGFLRADAIARNMGIEAHSPVRIRAGLLYVLANLARDGHTYAPREMLIDRARELLLVEDDPQLLLDNLEMQIASRNIINDTLNTNGDEMEALYLPIYYRAETRSAQYTRAIMQMPSRITEASNNITWQPFLAEIAKQNSVQLTEQQQNAVRAALISKISVLTGGPGTGKTTTLQMVIAALESLEFEFALASPTGRAAKRLSEATGHPASTIHRLLGYSPGSGFEYNEDAPLDVDMLVIDEASMIDLQLFYSMLSALKPETHLMLVGDVDQLPSVGAGNVLRDIIHSKVAYVTRLETIFRQDEKSHIILNAHRINKGDMPFMDNASSDFYFFGENDPTATSDLVVDIVKNRIPGKFGFDAMTEVQVIAPMYRGAAGIDTLNSLLQSALNGDKRYAEKKFNGHTFRVGDKVMQTRNNYEKDVFNGDIGRIYALDEEDSILEINFDDRIVYYDFSEVDELMHAYCISIHKSQGSEYPVVVIPLLTQHYMMLQRNLLYTAITRAREMVVLVGNRDAVRMAVRNNNVERRYSGLINRLVHPF